MDKKRVLIVDDETQVAEVIADFFEVIGFDARTLNSGENFLEMVKFFKPDLITLDMIMPDYSGLELLSNLRNDEETRFIPVLIVSAVGESVSALQEVTKHCQGVLTKPLTMKMLQQILETIRYTR